MPTPDDAYLRAEFQRWCCDPRTKLQLNPATTGAASSLQLIEDALWVAFRAGYSQALADNEAVQRVVDFLKHPQGE